MVRALCRRLEPQRERSGVVMSSETCRWRELTGATLSREKGAGAMSIRRTLAEVTVAAGLLVVGSTPVWAEGGAGTAPAPPSGVLVWTPITKVVTKTVDIPWSAGVSSAETAGNGGGLTVEAASVALTGRRRASSEQRG